MATAAQPPCVTAPQVDAKRDQSGANLSAMVLAKAEASVPSLAAAAAAPARGGGDALSASTLKGLRKRLSKVDKAEAEAEGEGGEEGVGGEDVAAVSAQQEAEEEAMLRAALPPDVAALHALFADCVVYCGRETPVRPRRPARPRA